MKLRMFMAEDNVFQVLDWLQEKEFNKTCKEIKGTREDKQIKIIEGRWTQKYNQ